MSKQVTIELGDEVECLASGHHGIVTGLVRWLTGCDQASVRAPLKEDGTMGESYFIDIHCLKVRKKARVVISDPARAVGGPAVRSPK